MFGTTYTLTLDDGRTLAYAVYGLPLHSRQEPTHVIIYHHGWPSSRLEGIYWEDAAQIQEARLIAVDRPGIGKSSFCHFTFKSFARDIEQLLNHLKLNKAIQVGTSGGGPYAAACAYYLPNRTAALGLVASMTPTSGLENLPLTKNIHWSNSLSFRAINSFPLAVRLALVATWPLIWAAPVVLGPLSSLASKYPSSYLATPLSFILATGFSEVDRKLMSQRPELTWRLGSYVVSEAVAAGTQGLMQDMVLTSKGPWEFDPGEVLGDIPAVVFQGTADVNVSMEMAEWWERKLPRCAGKYFEGEGHLTLVVNHAAEMVHILGEAAAKNGS